MSGTESLWGGISERADNGQQVTRERCHGTLNVRGGCVEDEIRLVLQPGVSMDGEHEIERGV